jgi:hypothetical protein
MFQSLRSSILVVAMVLAASADNNFCADKKDCYFGSLYPRILLLSANASSANSQHPVTGDVPLEVYSALARFTTPRYCNEYFADVVHLKRRLQIPTVVVRPQNSVCNSTRMFSKDDYAIIVAIVLLNFAVSGTLIYASTRK